MPATQACAGNRTGNLLVCRPELSPLSHTSQDITLLISLIHICCKKYNNNSIMVIKKKEKCPKCYFQETTRVNIFQKHDWAHSKLVNVGRHHHFSLLLLTTPILKTSFGDWLGLAQVPCETGPRTRSECLCLNWEVQSRGSKSKGKDTQTSDRREGMAQMCFASCWDSKRQSLDLT